MRIDKINNKQPREVKYYTRTTESWQLQLRIFILNEQAFSLLMSKHYVRIHQR